MEYPCSFKESFTASEFKIAAWGSMDAPTTISINFSSEPFPFAAFVQHAVNNPTVNTNTRTLLNTLIFFI